MLSHEKEFDCSNVHFDIKTVGSAVEQIRLNDVMESPDSKMSASNVAQFYALCKSHDHVNQINFPELEMNNISIIIGINHLDLIHNKQNIKGLKCKRKMHHGALKLQ